METISNKQLVIVSCTREKTFKGLIKRPLWKSLQKQYELNGDKINFHLSHNADEKGLSAVYNQFLTEYKDQYILFVHDDVELTDIFLYDKIVNSPYVVTGLAGAKEFNKKAENLAWHLAAPKESYVGEVKHAHAQSVWTTVFGPTKSRSLTLDGLFLAIDAEELNKKGVLFDEDFKFHFYDLAFCLRCNENKVSCGVLPIDVVHWGLGDSMNTTEWRESQTKFREKYCDDSSR